MPSAMEELSRLRKALRIAAWLRASEITSVAAACGNDNEWGAVMETLRAADPQAFRAGYIPSTDTRAAVCWILDILEDAAKVVAGRRKPIAEEQNA